MVDDNLHLMQTRAYESSKELVWTCHAVWGVCVSVGQIYDLGAETIDGLVGRLWKSLCVLKSLKDFSLFQTKKKTPKGLLSE